MVDRDQFELQSFVSKLCSLRSTGQRACLTVESRDFELSINLQLNLPCPVYYRPGPRPRPSPSRIRRRERRAAAATDKVVQPDLPVHTRADAAVQADQCVSPPPPPLLLSQHSPLLLLGPQHVWMPLYKLAKVYKILSLPLSLRVGVTPLLP